MDIETSLSLNVGKPARSTTIHGAPRATIRVSDESQIGRVYLQLNEDDASDSLTIFLTLDQARELAARFAAIIDALDAKADAARGEGREE